MTFGLTAAMASSDLQSPIIAASAPPTPSTPSVQVVPLRPSSGGSETQTNHVTPITPSSPSTQATTPTTQVTPTTQAAPAGPTTIDGQVIYNPFGAVQVEATFGADGSITDVKVLQAPNSNRLSVRINNYAVPVLNQEALSAQSAHINGVSGATYTSYGYERSLQSAIDSARAEAVTTLA